jgi:hypothetical protein
MVRDILRAEGLEERAGAISRRTSVEELVDALLPNGTLARA